MNFWFKWSTDTIPLGDRSSQMSNLVVSSLRSVYPLANFVLLSQQHYLYCLVFALVIVHQWKRSNGISIKHQSTQQIKLLNGLSFLRYHHLLFLVNLQQNERYIIIKLLFRFDYE